MNAFSQWLAPDVLRNLGLALSHFIWQGAAIAAIAAAAIALTRSAASRYLIGVAALLVMVAAPVATFMVLRNTPSAANQFANPGAPLTLLASPAAKIAALPNATLRQAPALSASALNWLVDNYQRFSDWQSSAYRVATLLLALDELETKDTPPSQSP